MTRTRKKDATTGIPVADDDALVQYKLPGNRDSQISSHSGLPNNDTKRLLENWRTEVQVLGKYAPYKEKVFFMLSDLDSMWDVYSGCVKTAKHHVEMVENHTKLVHSASYPAGSKII